MQRGQAVRCHPLFDVNGHASHFIARLAKRTAGKTPFPGVHISTQILRSRMSNHVVMVEDLIVIVRDNETAIITWWISRHRR